MFYCTVYFILLRRKAYGRLLMPFAVGNPAFSREKLPRKAPDGSLMSLAAKKWPQVAPGSPSPPENDHKLRPRSLLAVLLLSFLCQQFFPGLMLLPLFVPAVISRPLFSCDCTYRQLFPGSGVSADACAGSYFPAVVLLPLFVPAIISRPGAAGGSMQRPSSPPAENNCISARSLSTLRHKPG